MNKNVITSERIPIKRILNRTCLNCGKIIDDRSKSGLCIKCVRLGKLNPFYGKKHSESTKKIMKESAKIRDNSTYYKIPSTKEIIQKRELSKKINWNVLSIEEKHQKILPFIKAGIKHKKSKIEQIIKIVLNDIGMMEKIDYSTNTFIGGYNVDFLIHNEFIIECYGDYWHGNPKYYNTDYAINKRFKDRKRRLWLEFKGYKFINLWEEDIHKDLDKVKTRIEYFLGNYFNLFEWESCSCI